MLCVTRMTQNKNDSTNLILQRGRVFHNNCCVVFPTSRFPHLILFQTVQMQGSYHFLRYKG